MITYTWKNIELQCHKNLYGLTDVVFAIRADLEAEESGITEIENVFVGILEPDSENFILASDVTKDQAIQWIENNLDIENLKLSLERKLTTFTRIKISDS